MVGNPSLIGVTEELLVIHPQSAAGVLPDAVDPEGTLDVDLDPGDRVVLYTDGITDVL